MVVILRSALWDPFGKAEWACAEPALSEAEGKDLLFAFVFRSLEKANVIPTALAQGANAAGELEFSSCFSSSF